jgi:hypothetical protein
MSTSNNNDDSAGGEQQQHQDQTLLDMFTVISNHFTQAHERHQDLLLQHQQDRENAAEGNHQNSGTSSGNNSFGVPTPGMFGAPSQMLFGMGRIPSDGRGGFGSSDFYVPPPRTIPWRDKQKHKHVWSCLLEPPNTWSTYSADNQLMIEAAFREEGNKQANIRVYESDFQILFDEMVQVNPATGSKRKIVMIDAQDDSMIPFVTDVKQLLELNRQLGGFDCPVATAVDAKLSKLLNKPKYMAREDSERLPTTSAKNAIDSGAIQPDWQCGVCLQHLALTNETVLTMLPDCLHFLHQDCAVEYLAHLSYNCPICTTGVSVPRKET